MPSESVIRLKDGARAVVRVSVEISGGTPAPHPDPAERDRGRAADLESLFGGVLAGSLRRALPDIELIAAAGAGGPPIDWRVGLSVKPKHRTHPLYYEGGVVLAVLWDSQGDRLRIRKAGGGVVTEPAADWVTA